MPITINLKQLEYIDGDNLKLDKVNYKDFKEIKEIKVFKEMLVLPVENFGSKS